MARNTILHGIKLASNATINAIKSKEIIPSIVEEPVAVKEEKSADATIPEVIERSIPNSNSHIRFDHLKNPFA